MVSWPFRDLPSQYVSAFLKLSVVSGTTDIDDSVQTETTAWPILTIDAPQLVDRPGIVDWLKVDGVGIYGHPVPGIGYKVAFDAAFDKAAQGK